MSSRKFKVFINYYGAVTYKAGFFCVRFKELITPLTSFGGNSNEAYVFSSLFELEKTCSRIVIIPPSLYTA
jgi:hypothetical protein